MEIVSLIVAIVISMGSMTTLVLLGKAGAESVKVSALAQQGAIVNGAATKYVRDNAAALSTLATPTAPVSITLSTLKSEKYLPAGFSDKNAFQQTWMLQVRQPSPGQLEAIVVSIGGAEISSPKQLLQAAAQIGAQGGFIPYSNMLGNTSYSTASAMGSFGGWTLNMAGFTNPGPGHLVSLLAFAGDGGGGGAGGNYLYRVAVPGQPQLNAMQTDLGMTDIGGTAHNINGAATVNSQNVVATGSATAGTFSNTGGQFRVDAAGRVGSAGYAPSDLPGGWGGGLSTFDIYGHGTVAAGSGGAIATSMNSGGQLTAGFGNFVVTPAGVVNISSQGSSGAGCSRSGNAASITTDSAGVLLLCGPNNRWTPVGGRIQKADFYNAVDGTVIPVPACPSTAAPAVLVVASNIFINPTASASYFAPPGPGPWTVLIRDGSNAPIPGGAAQVETYCVYN